jgi:hypothetical protein
MVLRLNGVIDAPYYALFLVGPVTNAIDTALGSQNAPPSSTPSPIPAKIT